MSDHDVHAEGAEGANAADAQENLLPDSGLVIPAVQTEVITLSSDEFPSISLLSRRKREALPTVTSHIRAATTLPAISTEEMDGLAFNVEATVNRHVVPVVLRIGLLLEAVRIEVLLEVALPVKETHAHQRKAHIARGLHMIARRGCRGRRELWAGTRRARIPWRNRLPCPRGRLYTQVSAVLVALEFLFRALDAAI